MDACQNIEPLLDARDVKKLLRCSLPLVYVMARDGRLPCVRWECPPGKREGKGKKEPRIKAVVRFKKADIFRFIEANYTGRPSDYDAEATE